MHIYKLVAENFMKLNVEVEIDGKDVTVTGKNEVGKSTFINLIWYVLTGKEIPAEPIQQGQTEAKIQVEIKRDDGTHLICTRKFKLEGKDSLTVKTIEGATFTSPQAFLNSIIGQISFDHTNFLKMTPMEQKKWLQKTLGIDTTELETSKKIKLAELDSYKKQITQLEADLENLPTFATVLEERFLTEVADKQREIAEAKRKKDAISNGLAAIQNEQNDIMVAISNREGNRATNVKLIADMEAKIKTLIELNAKIDEEQNFDKLLLEKRTADAEEIKLDIQKVIIPPDTEIQKVVLEIQEHNKKFEQQKQRKEKEEKLSNFQALKISKDSELEQLEQDRVKLLQSVKMPIEGLDFTEEGLTFDGLPFVPNQFSTAKMDDIGIDICIALSPGLKVLRIKDWGLFDNDRKAAVTKKAKDHGFQIFREQVTEDESIGFIIEE